MAAYNVCGLCSGPTCWCSRRSRRCSPGNLNRISPTAKRFQLKPRLPSSFDCIDGTLLERFSLLEGHTTLVFCRDYRGDDRRFSTGFAIELPVDVQHRIIPRHRTLVLGRVKVRRFIDDVSGLRNDSEAVSKSPRNPYHAFVVTGKSEGLPFPEGGRVAAQVECDVKNLAGNRENDFPLRLANLVMHAADDISFGIGMIVLYERFRDAEFGKGALVVAFQKEAAVVAEHAGFEQ